MGTDVDSEEHGEGETADSHGAKTVERRRGHESHPRRDISCDGGSLTDRSASFAIGFWKRRKLSLMPVKRDRIIGRISDERHGTHVLCRTGPRAKEAELANRHDDG